MTIEVPITERTTRADRRSILIAGVGNMFLGDDGFGVEVARRLSERECSDDVLVEDFGIRGVDLAYALTSGHSAAILIDATRRGDPPGTLYALELDPDARSPDLVNAHAMDPASVLRLVAVLGGRPCRVFLVGCEPDEIDSAAEGHVGLTPRVAAAVDGAIEIVESLLARIRSS